MQILTKNFQCVYFFFFFIISMETWGQPGETCSTALNVSLQDPNSNPCSFLVLSGSGYNFGAFASNTISGATPGCGFGASNNDFWIRTQVPTNADGVKVAISNSTGSSNDLSNFVVGLYTGTNCSSLNYVTCKAGGTNTYFQYFDGMSPSQEVWLRFYKRNTTTGTFTDNFRIFLVATNTLGSNDACINAAPAVYGTYCNYSATNKGEPGGKTPLGLTGNSTICSGGSFNSFDNNQWYYINVDTSTIQPVTLNLRGVSCIGGAPRLQIGLWKAETNNCSLWGSGYDFTNATTAGDGFLLACAVGTGTVTINKSLPTGKYWFTADGGSGSFCTYTLTASPGVLPISFVDVSIAPSPTYTQLNWKYLSAKNVDHFVIQYSSDGKNFYSLEKVINTQRGTGWYSYVAQQTKDLELTYFRVQAVHRSGQIENSDLLANKMYQPKNIEVRYLSENRHWVVNNPFEGTSAEWSVYSTSGEQVDSKKFLLHQGINTLSSSLRPGVYLYQLSTEKHNSMGKLLIY